MNRTDKGFVLAVAVILFLIFGLLYPLVVLLPFLAFIAGMGVGGGVHIFERIGGGLLKQFRNPQKTHTARPAAKRTSKSAKSKK